MALPVESLATEMAERVLSPPVSMALKVFFRLVSRASAVVLLTAMICWEG